MRRRLWLFVTPLLGLSVILSGVLVNAPVVTGSGAPLTESLAETSDALAPKDKQQRNAQAKPKRQRAQRQQAAQGREQGRVGALSEFCDAPGLEKLPGARACTHGPDPAPPGLSVNRRVPLLPARAARQQAQPISCDGDGQSGFRIQVFYIHGNNVPSRFDAVHATLLARTADADQIFRNSAAATGGTRALRFVQNPSNCLPIIQPVALSPAAIGDFGQMITELDALGHNRVDRNYLLWVDTTSAGICGVGTFFDDDRADGDLNWNNVGPGWARADAGCWTGRVAAHELMHNLGGVQNSAPNTSGGGHCVDEYDVMCYSDTPNYPVMRAECPHEYVDEFLLDCHHDDYYHTNPAPGSYLANFWNPANNQFLIRNVPPPPPDTVPPVVQKVGAPNRPVAGRRIKLSTAAADNVAVHSVAFGVCTGSSPCTWARARKLPVDGLAPYSVFWRVPTRGGTFTFLARATDTSGNATVSAPKRVTVKPKPRR